MSALTHDHVADAAVQCALASAAVWQLLGVMALVAAANATCGTTEADTG